MTACVSVIVLTEGSRQTYMYIIHQIYIIISDIYHHIRYIITSDIYIIISDLYLLTERQHEDLRLVKQCIAYVQAVLHSYNQKPEIRKSEMDNEGKVTEEVKSW